MALNLKYLLCKTTAWKLWIKSVNQNWGTVTFYLLGASKCCLNPCDQLIYVLISWRAELGVGLFFFGKPDGWHILHYCSNLTIAAVSRGIQHSKNFCPFLYYKCLHKYGQDFLDIQYFLYATCTTLPVFLPWCHGVTRGTGSAPGWRDVGSGPGHHSPAPTQLVHHQQVSCHQRRIQMGRGNCA